MLIFLNIFQKKNPILKKGNLYFSEGMKGYRKGPSITSIVYTLCPLLNLSSCLVTLPHAGLLCGTPRLQIQPFI